MGQKEENDLIDRVADRIVERIGDRIGELIDKKLERFADNHPSPQMLYTRIQAANLLGTSLSTLKKLIDRGDLRVRRWGSSVMVPHEELLRVAKKDFSILWPERNPDGKTQRA